MRRQVVAAMAVTALVLLDGGVAHAAAPSGKGKPTSESPSQTGFHNATHSAWCSEVVPDDPPCSATVTADATSATLDVAVAVGRQDSTVPARHRTAGAVAALEGYRSNALASEWVAVVSVDHLFGSSTGTAGGGSRLELSVPTVHGRVVRQFDLWLGEHTLEVAGATSGTAYVTLRSAASNGSVRHGVGWWDFSAGIPLCQTGYSGFPPCTVGVPGVWVPLPTVMGSGRAESSVSVEVLSLELR